MSTDNPFHVEFFNKLTPTRKTGTCPRCGQAGLEERATGPRGEKYVLHCGSVQSSYSGDRLKVVLELVAEARAQAEAIARADSVADFELLALEGVR